MRIRSNFFLVCASENMGYFFGNSLSISIKTVWTFFVNEPFSQFCPRTPFEGHLALSENLNNCDV